VTLLVACTACVLALLGATLISDLAAAATARARAQAAADAAALAAVAESAPQGGGRPARSAARYAVQNGARLVSCRCPPGATDAVVKVALGGVVAEARAVLEPRLLAPGRGALSPQGLHPALDASVRRLLDAAAGSVWITSGHRSRRQQGQLWAAAVARYGSAEAADDWVARPGHSLHERGLAVDLGGDIERAAALVSALGLPLRRPLPNEPWHFELAGARG